MNLHMRLLQNSRFRMQLIKGSSILQPTSYANIWFNNVHGIGHTRGRNSVKPAGLNTNAHIRVGLKQGFWFDDAKRVPKRLESVDKRKRLSGRLQRRQITTDVYTPKNSTQIITPVTLRPGVLDVIASNTNIDIHEPEINEVKGIQLYGAQQNIECRYTHRLATTLVFDIETTGFSKNDRIIEFAVRDLSGGENSVLETLVNPERSVRNTNIHGISTHMVNQPGVPRFKDLVPILLQYVETRRIPGTPLLWVAHNARSFDVPFLMREFALCSKEIPPEWKFLDTLPLSRELSKLEGTENLEGNSMQHLREYYGIPLVGKAHRALTDVNSLAKILQALTNDLKLPVSSLLERSFKASDIGGKKEKMSTN